MASTLDILSRLIDRRVEFVVVGGLAGIVHGSSIVTEDVDVCAPLTEANLTRILDALEELEPRFRMSPDRPALPADPKRLAGFKNLNLLTTLGQLDILSEITGVGNYDEVRRQAVELDVSGMPCHVLGLDALIAAKQALGRPKDLRAAIELEAIRNRLRHRDA